MPVYKSNRINKYNFNLKLNTKKYKFHSSKIIKNAQVNIIKMDEIIIKKKIVI